MSEAPSRIASRMIALASRIAGGSLGAAQQQLVERNRLVVLDDDLDALVGSVVGTRVSSSPRNPTVPSPP